MYSFELLYLRYLIIFVYYFEHFLYLFYEFDLKQKNN